jgi:hypothetical protein
MIWPRRRPDDTHRERGGGGLEYAYTTGVKPGTRKLQVAAVIFSHAPRPQTESSTIPFWTATGKGRPEANLCKRRRNLDMDMDASPEG